MDDLRVVLRVRRRRYGLDQGVQICGAAHLGDLAALGEFGGDRDGVGGFSARVDVENRLIDRFVGRFVEVVALEDLDHVGDGFLGQEHATEDRLFGVQVLRGDALEGGAALPRAAVTAPVVLFVPAGSAVAAPA
ncbi:hypothetical protein QFZ63_004102 [Streptomyces sp. B3I7]|nr:hypothetical protein [Streptomyces sp. B3I7]